MIAVFYPNTCCFSFCNTTLVNGLDWSYEFIADVTGLFTLDYDVTGSGSDTFGLNGFNFLWSDPGGAQFLGLNTSGTLTRAITVRETYTVTITNQANIFGGLGTRDALMDGTFNWSISTGITVPEPSSTLSLLALGTLGAGSALLRKRKQQKSAIALTNDAQ